MQQISCDLCQNSVYVERYTENQVSIQWVSDAEVVCVEFARKALHGERSATTPVCSALRATIEINVANRVIRVGRRRQHADITEVSASAQ